MLVKLLPWKYSKSFGSSHVNRSQLVKISGSSLVCFEAMVQRWTNSQDFVKENSVSPNQKLLPFLFLSQLLENRTSDFQKNNSDPGKNTVAMSKNRWTFTSLASQQPPSKSVVKDLPLWCFNRRWPQERHNESDLLATKTIYPAQIQCCCWQISQAQAFWSSMWDVCIQQTCSAKKLRSTVVMWVPSLQHVFASVVWSHPKVNV